MRKALALVVLLACGSPAAPTEYAWELPPGFQPPPVPADNPMSADKVELGRALFSDTRLSGNGTQSCASCHDSTLAFTDGKPVAIGSTGEHGRHGAMSLLDVGYSASLTWSSDVPTLEAQALRPMYGTAPVELGLDHANDAALVAQLDDAYGDLFASAFPDDEPSIETVVQAIAAYERTLISGRSPFDRFVAGDTTALSPAEQHGGQLFESDKLACTHCHGGFTTSSNVLDRNVFFNTGLYRTYPANDRGLIEVTNVATDEGRFRPPPLRNIALTAPYMHDGSAATLDDVIDIYVNGGRGDGALDPHKAPQMTGFVLSPQDRADLIAFLGALTDEPTGGP
ncbi:MAG TPA: cytochrome c peroxidase [Kofleriaceae bacterium]|jgi:cytochrome c peroxidase